MSEAERKKLLLDWNRTERDYRVVVVHELFEECAARAPGALAVESESGLVSYGELNDRANRLAHHLRGLGVGPDVLVGLCVERGVEMMVGILGIVKAGGAYVPLDPEYPAERLSFMLEDAEAPVMVTQAGVLERLPETAARIVCVDRDWPVIEACSGENPEGSASAASLAYMIYTSGSTGRPKGVPITHGNLCNLVHWHQQAYEVTAADRATQIASPAFDASVWEIWPYLTAGASVHIPEEATRVDPARLVRWLIEQCITASFLPTPLAEAVLRETWPKDSALRVMLTGGDRLNQRPAQSLPFRLVNHYGPTENTVVSTCCEVQAGPGLAAPPIGRPLPNTRAYVVDQHLQPVPIGVSGELLVGGAQLSAGYWNRPELTAEKFVADPFDATGAGRLYRTGDLVRWLPDGNLEFVGRIDNQVKVRGFRIELGEIEAVLNQQPQVRQAVVTVHEDELGGRRIIAYVVAGGGRTRALGELRGILKQHLPDYMVPSAFIAVDKIPLTLNGKVDRSALPKPTEECSLLSTDYRAPSTSLETALVAVWMKALKTERIGVDDNFFELGGDSLIGAVLINTIQQRLGIKLYVVMLFEAPTVAEQAEYLTRHFPEVLRTGFGEIPSDHAEHSGSGSEAAVRCGSILNRDVEIFRGLAGAWHQGGSAGGAARQAATPNPKMVFILTTPRSGSSLLRIMLAGHAHLFAPPELELLSFDSMRQRRQRLGGGLSFMREGLVRAIMELRHCDADAAARIVAEYETRDESTQAIYGLLQQSLGDRLLVDKSATYSLAPEILQRAEERFEGSVYIHLVRHPYGTVRSFEEARLDRILRLEDEDHYSVRQFAELTWIVSHQNILRFLSGVPAHRQIRIRFEDLVRDTRSTVEPLCERLGVEFDPLLLDPYRDQERRMTDSVNALSVGMTDPKFHAHSEISADVADRWQAYYSEDFLSETARELAEELGYEPRVSGSAVALVPVERLRRDPASSPAQSYAQQRLWFFDRLAPGNPGYNTSRVIQIDGPLDAAVLERGLNEIIARHEVCRTNYGMRDGDPVQIIHDSRALKLRHFDLGELQPAAQATEVERIARTEIIAAFDLTRDPLWRAAILRLGPRRHVLVLVIHHILSDAWSRGVIHRELSAFYNAAAAGQPLSLGELPLQYCDYAAWQRRMMEESEGLRLRSYWVEQMRDAPATLDLPMDRMPPPVQTYVGASRELRLPGELIQRLKRLSQAEGVTLFMTLLSAFNVLLNRYSGQPDIVVGIPVSGRSRAEFEAMVGQFVNILPIRTQFPVNCSVRALLKQVRDTCLAAFSHQDCPFDMIVSGLKLERSLNVNPLCQVMFALEPAQLHDLELTGLRCTPLNVGLQPMAYDLTVIATEEREGIHVVIDYKTELFDPATIERMARHYEQLLKEMVATPELCIDELPLLSALEREQLLVDWNGAGEDYRVVVVHELFEECAARAPGRWRLTSESGLVSYGELNDRANRLAHHLRGLGVGPDVLVGLCVERGVEMMVGILGIVKAGGAYVPLDPEYPAERLSFMLEDAEAPVMVTQAGVLERLPETAARIVCVDRDWPVIEACSGENPEGSASAASLAYMIYTSGSTGRPKGVPITHGNLCNLVHWHQQAYEVTAADRATQIASPAFDASVWEIWPYLRRGRVCTFPKRRPGWIQRDWCAGSLSSASRRAFCPRRWPKRCCARLGRRTVRCGSCSRVATGLISGLRSHCHSVW